MSAKYVIYQNWIIEYIDIYSYGIIYSCTVNVNLMLICIELLVLIIYCKYGWKFLYIFLYYTFLPVFSSLTDKSHMRDPPSLKIGFCCQPISMPNNITRQYQRHIKNPIELLRWSSFIKKLTARKSLTNFAENAPF